MRFVLNERLRVDAPEGVWRRGKSISLPVDGELSVLPLMDSAAYTVLEEHEKLRARNSRPNGSIDLSRTLPWAVYTRSSPVPGSTWCVGTPQSPSRDVWHGVLDFSERCQFKSTSKADTKAKIHMA